jgi:hypothetical protein
MFRERPTLLTRRRNKEAHPADAGDKPTVSRVALILPFASFCCGLAVLTIFWPDWMEALTGYDPDQHDGNGRVAHLDSPLVICAVLALAARAEWTKSSSLD